MTTLPSITVAQIEDSPPLIINRHLKNYLVDNLALFCFGLLAAFFVGTVLTFPITFVAIAIVVELAIIVNYYFYVHDIIVPKVIQEVQVQIKNYLEDKQYYEKLLPNFETYPIIDISQKSCVSTHRIDCIEADELTAPIMKGIYHGCIFISFKVKIKDPQNWRSKLPTYRQDINIEAYLKNTPFVITFSKRFDVGTAFKDALVYDIFNVKNEETILALTNKGESDLFVLQK